MTRHNEHIVNHAALNTIGGELGLILYLGIILVEVLGQIDRLVGLDFSLIQLSR